MFGLGAMEIGVIVVMAVLLFPAKELPKLVRTIARFYGQIRKTAEDFRSAVLDDEDLREPIDQIRGAYNDARFEVRDAERKARQQLAKAQMEMRMATAKRIQAEREAEKAKAAAAAAVAAASGTEGEGDSATPASPVQIAANDSDSGSDGASDAEEAASSGPVAGPDPRRIAPRQPPAYTPPSAEPTSSGDDEPREGVA